MRFKITAFRTVEVCGFVKTKVRNGKKFVWRDKPQKEWITIKAGEVRDYLGMIDGVDAKYAPEEAATDVCGRPLVSLGVYEPGKLYFGLFLIESVPSDE